MPWLVLAAALALAGALRWRLADMPLERDEGEYAYAGQLLLDGVPPYRLAYNMKYPGTYAAYALIMAVFGQTPRGIHAGVILVTSATAVLVFFVGRRLFGAGAGAAAAACHAVLATNPSFLALAGHASHFVALAAMGGVALVLRGLDRGGRWIFLAAGACFGLAILMKQPGAVFLAFAALYLAVHEWRARPRSWRRTGERLGLLLGAAALVLGATFLALAAAGVFGTFWFWTFEYARAYGGYVSLEAGARQLMTMLERFAWPMLGLAALSAAGIAAVLLCRRYRAGAAAALGLLVFSFIGTGAGLHFRHHYFILMLPALALLAGAAGGAAADLLGRTRLGRAAWAVPAAALAASCGWMIAQERAVLFEGAPAVACRTLYTMNPFPESIEIAGYIESRTSPGDTIAVLGSEPQIYFYARRRSATGYIYTYGLMEPQPFARRMQEEMIAEIEAARPAYVVVSNVVTSWVVRPDSDRTIFEWGRQYLARNYDRVGVIDILSATRTDYYWNEWAAQTAPRSSAFLAVYKRRS